MAMHMIYPERRTVSDEAVLSMASDAWHDNAPRNRCSTCGTITVVVHHGQPVAEVREGEFAASDPVNPCACLDGQMQPMTNEPFPGSLADAADYLEHHGLVTFKRGRK